jgi:hypothetical protein
MKRRQRRHASALTAATKAAGVSILLRVDWSKEPASELEADLRRRFLATRTMWQLRILDFGLGDQLPASDLSSFCELLEARYEAEREADRRQEVEGFMEQLAT